MHDLPIIPNRFGHEKICSSFRCFPAITVAILFTANSCFYATPNCQLNTKYGSVIPCTVFYQSNDAISNWSQRLELGTAELRQVRLREKGNKPPIFGNAEHTRRARRFFSTDGDFTLSWPRVNKIEQMNQLYLPVFLIKPEMNNTSGSISAHSQLDILDASGQTTFQSIYPRLKKTDRMPTKIVFYFSLSVSSNRRSYRLARVRLSISQWRICTLLPRWLWQTSSVNWEENK